MLRARECDALSPLFFFGIYGRSTRRIKSLLLLVSKCSLLPNWSLENITHTLLFCFWNIRCAHNAEESCVACVARVPEAAWPARRNPGFSPWISRKRGIFRVKFYDFPNVLEIPNRMARDSFGSACHLLECFLVSSVVPCRSMALTRVARTMRIGVRQRRRRLHIAGAQ